MINMDNTQFAGLLIITLALVAPVFYAFFIDHHKKGTPDPRDNSF